MGKRWGSRLLNRLVPIAEWASSFCRRPILIYLFWRSVLTSQYRLQIQGPQGQWTHQFFLVHLPTWLSATVLLLLRPSALEGVQNPCCQPFSSPSTPRFFPGLLGLSFIPRAAPQAQPLHPWKLCPYFDSFPTPTGQGPVPFLATWYTTAQALLTSPALFYIFPLLSWTL